MSEAAPLTFRVDGTPPRIELTDTWYIWEAGEVTVRDRESGLTGVEIEIRDPQNRWPKVSRAYEASGERFTTTITWDRHFGDGTLAPIGTYDVVVKAFDRAGNMERVTAHILIPALGATPLAPTVSPTPKVIPFGSSMLSNAVLVPSLAPASENPPSVIYNQHNNRQSAIINLQSSVGVWRRWRQSQAQGIERTGERLAGAVSRAAENTAQSIERGTQAAGRAVQAVFQAVSRGIETVGNAAAQGVRQVTQVAAQAVNNTGQALARGSEHAASAVASWVKPFSPGLANSIELAGQAVSQTVSNVTQRISSTITQTGQALSSAIQRGTQMAASAIRNVGQSAANLIVRGGQTAANIVRQAGQVISGGVRTATSWASSLVRSTTSSITSWLRRP